jgi:hypothetical protein
MFNLQVVRVVQCAGNPARRLFTDPRELLAWLKDCLPSDERDLLGALVAGYDPHPTAPAVPGHVGGA